PDDAKIGLGPVPSTHQTSIRPLDLAPWLSHSRRPNVPISVTGLLSSSIDMLVYSVRAWSATVKHGALTPLASDMQFCVLVARFGMPPAILAPATSRLPTSESAIV